MKILDKLLGKIDNQVNAKIKKLISNLSPKEKNELLKDPKLVDELLKEVDVKELAKHYSSELFSGHGEVVIDYSEKRKQYQLARLDFLVNTFTEFQTEALRKFIIDNKKEFRDNLVELVMTGGNKRMVKKYFANTPFTFEQIGSIIYKVESDIRRATVLSAYEEYPETKFRYIGGLIPTSSKTCTWLMENQKQEGYTLKEIQAGIETPFGKVDWWGKVPNWGCIHSFEPIINWK